MKFNGITAVLVLTGAVTAVAIPRDTTVSTSNLDSTLNQLDGLINKIEPTINELAGDVNANVDLSTLQSQLSDIRSQINALVPSKRDILEGTAGTVGNTVGTVKSAAAPVTDAVNPVVEEASSITKRDTVSNAPINVTSILSNPVNTVNQLTPLASNFCSGIESNVPLSQSVDELTALTQGLSVYAQLPLTIIQLPSSI